MFPSVERGAVQAQVDALTNLVAGLEPDAVALVEAPGLWRGFDAIERLAGGAKLLLARKIDESGVWERAGDRDAGVWLARHGGTSITAARAALGASRRLADLPETRAALRRGALSVAQAGPIADAAAHAPDAEQDLLGRAGEMSLSELRRECGRVKAGADPDPERTWERIRANRRLRHGVDGEGAAWLSGKGTIDDTAELLAVLEPVIDEIFHQARSEGRAETREAYAWDALIELARRAHDWTYNNEPDNSDNDRADDNDPGDPSDDSGGAGHADPDRPAGSDRAGDDGRDRPSAPRGERATRSEPRRPAGRKKRPGRPREGRRRRMNEKYLALVRVDLDALARGETYDGEACEIGGVTVPVAVARRVLGKAVLKLVLTRGEHVAATVHLGRGPNAAQKVALRWLSPTCRAEGCNRTDLEWDHRVDWRKTHRTVLWELDGLCTHHHDLKTRKGWALVPGTGKRPMVAPDDPRHPRHDRPRPAAA